MHTHAHTITHTFTCAYQRMTRMYPPAHVTRMLTYTLVGSGVREPGRQPLSRLPGLHPLRYY